MATGNYCETYETASFKGVVFQAMTVDSQHGRRGAEGEFPFAEHTGYVDLGRRIRKYSLSGRYVDNNHVQQAEELIAACESPGPGILVHPTRGPIMVACTSLKVKDDVLEGQGITLIDLEFVEANENISPVDLVGDFLGLGIDGFIGSVSDIFTGNYAPTIGLYSTVVDIVGTVGWALSMLGSAYGKTIGIGGSLSQWNTLSAFDTASTNSIAAKKSDWTIKQLSSGFKVLDGALATKDKFPVYKSIINQNAQSSSLPGTAGRSQNAIYSAMRLIAVSYMAQSSYENTPSTLSEALSQYDDIMGVLENEAQIARAACDDKSFLIIRAFAAEISAKLLKKAYKSPAVVSYNFGGAVHSLVASYEIFGDAKKFGLIESQNKTSYPFALGPQVISRTI